MSKDCSDKQFLTFLPQRTQLWLRVVELNPQQKMYFILTLFHALILDRKVLMEVKNPAFDRFNNLFLFIL